MSVDRPTVLLLHGQPGSSLDWGRVRELLEGAFRTLAPDRPGYDPTSPEARGVRGNAKAAVDLLDEEGVEQAIVCGWSFGGAVALRLSQLHPSRVSGLVLVSPAADADALGVMDRVLALPLVGEAIAYTGLRGAGLVLGHRGVRSLVASRRRGLDEAYLAATARRLRDGRTWRTFVAEQRALVRELRAEPERGRHPAPTVVVVGDADRSVPLAAVESLATRLGARLEVVEGGSHLLPLEAPERVADAIRSIAS